MTSLVVDTEDCLEQCEGTIANVITKSDAKNEDGLKAFLKDYEMFKFPDLVNLRYPKAGPPGFNFKLRRKLKYVQISFSASTFDRIKKVSIQYIIWLTSITIVISVFDIFRTEQPSL